MKDKVFYFEKKISFIYFGKTNQKTFLFKVYPEKKSNLQKWMNY